MSLTNCYECNHEVSDLAISCRNCGAPLQGQNVPLPVAVKKRSPLVRLFAVIGFVVVLGALGLWLFNSLSTDENKRDMYELLDMENSKLADMTSYIVLDEKVRRNTWDTKWVFSGTIGNSHPNRSFTRITVKFNFSNTSYTEVFTMNFSPDALVQNKPFIRKVKGDGDATYLGAEVIAVE